ncbi:TIGR02594 family protein [Mesorhizobium sp. YC-39]|uniref:TIGR02594 family protein n=1 Tax=unclassified Mesorhizobium TaxID=325217 RepID=UPI0021E7E4A7|nr:MULTISPECIES: TIGR02594 family protein [unclassified Mesorhizobium]MCV3211557.1 TIGR02594 family protein [Mesorhizobium sp. YC-2]MCV3233245.1 TIGR02594 family protein [Mesorhizobium sp. YC-39]
MDNKPWWVIVLAAALGAFGAEAVKAMPSAYSWLRSFYPIDPNVIIFVRAADTHEPVDGVVVSIIDSNLTPIALVGTDKTETVTNKKGLATLHVSLMPSVNYAISLTEQYQGTEFQYTFPVIIKDDIQQSFDFDTQTWAKKAENPVMVANDPKQDISPSDNLPGWMKFAYAELGQKEVTGAGINPRIAEYWKVSDTQQKFDNDDIDWSSVFVGWALKQVGIEGTHSAINRTWLSWGKEVDLQPGCIAVFWRESPSSPYGHAGFVLGQNGNAITVLGGNQSNAVSITQIQKSRLLGCRMPG